ncbi:phosphoribosyltransferase [Candidatus Woesearchaeota archaeon]|nr:phosphoribosyltransferase [Candidatus Woesearchaeota archaeon]
MKKYVTLRQVVNMCKALAKAIIKDGYKPDLIIGLSRGGWVPARFIADELQLTTLASIGVKSYEAVNKKTSVKLTERLGLSVKGKKVLVVDDIADTGDTLKFIEKYLKAKGALTVKTATLHVKPKICKHKPDYYAKPTNAWIVYPWELVEDKTKWV